MEKFPCNTDHRQFTVYSLLLIKDIPEMIKQGWTDEQKPWNKGRRNGRGGGRRKGRKGNSKRVESGGNYWTMLIYISQRKEAIKKRRTTFPLISNKLYMTSEMILSNFQFSVKQLRHFFKNSTIVDRLGIQNQQELGRFKAKNFGNIPKQFQD